MFKGFFVVTTLVLMICSTMVGCSNSSEIVKPEKMGAKPTGLTKEEKSAGAGNNAKSKDGMSGAKAFTPVE